MKNPGGSAAAPAKPPKRDFLTTQTLKREEVLNLLDLAARMKLKGPGSLLAGKTLGLIFFDKSLRTRVSFEVAMVQLGGHCVIISSAHSDIYELEPEERAVMDGRAKGSRGIKLSR